MQISELKSNICSDIVQSSEATMKEEIAKLIDQIEDDDLLRYVLFLVAAAIRDASLEH